MKAWFRLSRLLPPLLVAASANISNAESPPNEILMNATKRTSHITSAFKKGLASQKFGAGLAGD